MRSSTVSASLSRSGASVIAVWLSCNIAMVGGEPHLC